MRTQLTDLQIWTLLNAPDMTDVELAAVLGVKTSTVHGARWRLRRNGWTCSVRYAPCRLCGDTATLRGRSVKHAYHSHCRPAARRQIQQRLDEARPVMPEQVKRFHQWTDEAQQRSRTTATRTWARWTKDEDDILIALANRPLEVSCEELGRTLYAVNARRVVLRRRGRIS